MLSLGKAGDFAKRRTHFPAPGPGTSIISGTRHRTRWWPKQARCQTRHGSTEIATNILRSWLYAKSLESAKKPSPEPFRDTSVLVLVPTDPERGRQLPTVCLGAWSPLAGSVGPANGAARPEPANLSRYPGGMLPANGAARPEPGEPSRALGTEKSAVERRSIAVLRPDSPNQRAYTIELLGGVVIDDDLSSSQRLGPDQHRSAKPVMKVFF